jgi:hypothetical protein
MHMLQRTDFCRDDSHWCYFVVSALRTVDSFFGVFDVEQRENDRHIVIRMLRGRHSETPESVLREWSAALQFPYYFGHNWDAFDECITDLEWLPGTCYVLVVTQIDQVLPNFAEDFNIFVRSLRWAHEQWKIPNRGNMDEPIAPFTIVFHAEPERADTALARLRAAGADPVEARLSDGFFTLTPDRP